MRTCVVSIFVLAAACTSTTPPPSAAKAEPTAPAKVEPSAEVPAAAPARFACREDRECVASCLHGAVARAWHTAAYPGGEACQDGCTSKGTEPPRCEQGKCVAYRAGAPDPVCTNVANEPVPEPR